MVTGANAGIGLLTCLELAEAGFDVIGTARSAEKAEVVQRAAHDRGLALRTVELEVDDAEACAAVAAQVAGMTGGGPWGLVNNAGFAQSGAVEDVSDELVRAQLETNLVAPLRLARLFLPAMRARGDGRIVNISSIAGRLAAPLLGWYSASKHALEGVTDALRVEVAPDGVRVVLVEPGMFATDVWSAAQDGGYPPASTPRYAAAYARSAALAGHSRKLQDPVWVARTVRVALTHPRPLARYMVGADAVAGLTAHSVLPTAVTDLVKSVTTGLRPLPSWRQRPR
ncbi:MAG: Short-chain dehydrogenase/reductase [Frankiales bacterium]|nr:Short-chain dehydrogenase/reductase [Frankiales bacterium]